jgi:predicted secreted hydrolase
MGTTADGLRIGVETTLEGTLPGWKFGESKTVIDGLDGFAWVVPLPRARCRGTIFLGDRTIPVEGTGYHDHNWGQVSLSRLVSYWHWGRIYAGEVTCIYADVVGRRRRSSDASGLLMLAVGERIIFNTSLVRIEEQDLAFSPKADRTYPRILRITSEMDGAPVEITLRSRELVGAYDFLATLSPLRRRLLRLATRPAYFRHRSDVHLHFTYGVREYDLHGEVLNEDMYLQRR